VTVTRPTAHTLQQREAEAARDQRDERARGAEAVRELNGSTRRQIAEVWWEETRRKA